MPTTQQHPGLLIVLVGPSGVGKSTVARQLATQMPDLQYIISATTRPKKPGDDKGKTYEHITREEFFRRLDADLFLEYAQVYDDYYGTPKHPAMDYLAAGQNVLLEIDVQGALQVKYQYPHALMIFLLPPGEQTLLQRLTDRARDSAGDIQKRFRNARREIQMAKGSRAFDHMVTNDDLQKAVQEITTIIRQQSPAR